jgi:hypothetical protein
VIALGVFNFLIAVAIGLVVATLLPAIRRRLPARLERAIWLVFAFACVMAFLDVSDPHSRELASDLAWATGQVIFAGFAVALASSGAWLGRHPVELFAVSVAGGAVMVGVIHYARNRRAPRLSVSRTAAAAGTTAAAAVRLLSFSFAPWCVDCLRRGLSAVKPLAREAVRAMAETHAPPQLLAVPSQLLLATPRFSAYPTDEQEHAERLAS